MCHIGTWSTRYCMRTAEKVWSSKVKKIWFAECQKMTLGKVASLSSIRRRHSAKALRRRLFAECHCLTLGKLGKPPLCRVSGVCRVLSLWHSANSPFAECPIKSTRQSVGHSAKKSSPVVQSKVL